MNLRLTTPSVAEREIPVYFSPEFLAANPEPERRAVLNREIYELLRNYEYRDWVLYVVVSVCYERLHRTLCRIRFFEAYVDTTHRPLSLEYTILERNGRISLHCNEH